MEDHRKMPRPRKGAGMKHHFNGKRKKEQQALWNANYRAKKRAEKPEVRAAAREAALREIKERQRKAKASKKK